MAFDWKKHTALLHPFCLTFPVPSKGFATYIRTRGGLVSVFSRLPDPACWF